MEPRISLVTLGVSDLQRATRFYADVLELPQIETPPEVAFFEMGKTWLSLYPLEELAADAGMAADASAFPRFSLAHNVRSETEVDRLLDQISTRGGKIVQPAHRTDWGGYAGIFADPDGFLWEVAHNPHFPHT